MSVQTERPINNIDWVNQLFEETPAPAVPEVRKKYHGHPYAALALKIGAASMATSLVSVGAGYGLYAEGFLQGAIPHATANQKILEPGKATVTFVDKDPLQSVILADYVTDLKKGHGVEVGYVEKLTGLLSWVTPDDETLTRDAVAVDQLTFDPGAVTITYVPKGNHLVYSIPESSLSTNVYIEPGTDVTEPASQSKSFMDLPEQEATIFAEDSAGTANQLMQKHNLTAAQVPLLGAIAAHTTSVQSAMENFADLDIVTQVDQVCTPKVLTEVAGLKTAIAQNIKTAEQGRLYDPQFRSELGDLLNQKPSVIADALANATVKEQAYKFGPDQSNLATLKLYTSETGAFTSSLNESNITCNVDDKLKTSIPATGDAK